MQDTDPPPEPTRQLDELRSDPEFHRMIGLVAHEVAYHWHLPGGVAKGFVISAIGEPVALCSIYNAWRTARQSGGSLGLPKLIMRRRVVDLLRKDARPPSHVSLMTEDDDEVVRIPDDRASARLELRHPRCAAEQREVCEQLRVAMACFASQGPFQLRQMVLLQRHVIDDIDYVGLSMELSCTVNACRVRVHKAKRALQRHISVCHGELADWMS